MSGSRELSSRRSSPAPGTGVRIVSTGTSASVKPIIISQSFRDAFQSAGRQQINQYQAYLVLELCERQKLHESVGKCQTPLSVCGLYQLLTKNDIFLRLSEELQRPVYNFLGSAFIRTLGTDGVKSRQPALVTLYEKMEDSYGNRVETEDRKKLLAAFTSFSYEQKKLLESGSARHEVLVSVTSSLVMRMLYTLFRPVNPKDKSLNLPAKSIVQFKAYRISEAQLRQYFDEQIKRYGLIPVAW